MNPNNVQLSIGAIQAMWNGQTPPNPIVQIIDCRKVVNQGTTANNQDRYRLIISDSIHYQQAMVATQLNELITSNIISNRCVVRLNEYLCNVVHGRNLEPLSQPLPATIGTPVSIDQPSGNSPSSSPSNSSAPVASSSAPPSSAPNGGRPSVTPSSAIPQQPNFSNPPSHSPMPMNQPPKPAPMPQPPQQPVNVPQPMRQPPVQPPQQYQQQPQQQWQPPVNPGNQVPSPVQHQPPHNPVHQPIPQQQHHTNGHAPASPDHIAPIHSLNPYKHKWTIKARVTNKSEVKTWQNARGEGKLASIDLVDFYGGEIRATMFQETLDRLYPLFQLNKVYMISKGSIKAANKKFSTLANEWELTLNNETAVQQCEDGADIPRLNYSFVSIGDIQHEFKDAIKDVIGVVLETFAPTKVLTKGGKELSKRNIKLADSGHSIELTLWGAHADNPGWQEFDHPVVAFKGLLVSDYRNRTLSTRGSTMMEVNPDVAEAHNIRNWYCNTGGRVDVPSLSFGNNAKKKTSDDDSQPIQVKTFAQIRDENIGATEQQTITVKGTITIMKRENGNVMPWYPACPNHTCGGKKATYDALQNSYHCAKCDQTFPTPDMRYLLGFSAADHTGNAWLSSFNEVGAALLGKKAPEMAYLKDADPAVYETTWQESTFRQYNFKVKATPDNYQEQARVRLSVIGAYPLNFVNESKSLITMIQQLS